MGKLWRLAYIKGSVTPLFFYIRGDEMFTLNDDLSIYATRGDTVSFAVCADEDGEPYSFKAGDVVRIKVFGKKDAEKVFLQKDFPITEDTTEVEILLTKEDTKFGDAISKPKDYWYEIVLNDNTFPHTIIGYDEDGPKVFKLFPEGDDVPPFEPEPEEVRVIDDELDMTSTRPVQNQAVARAVTRLRAVAGESSEQPGCYYRMVNGVKEWINPPMLIGVEYRTTERWKGKPVFTKVVDCGNLPSGSSGSSGYKSVNGVALYADDVLSQEPAYRNNAKNYDTAFLDGASCGAMSYGGTINIEMSAKNDFSAWTAIVKIRYTKQEGQYA